MSSMKKRIIFLVKSNVTEFGLTATILVIFQNAMSLAKHELYMLWYLQSIAVFSR